MLEFRPVALSDREWLEPILLAAPDRGCEYTFGNIFIWSGVSDIDVAKCGEGAVIRFGKNPPCYLFPVGVSDERDALGRMLCDCTRNDCDFCIIAARREDCETVERLYPNRFKYHETRHFAEYVYNSDDLINLAGKKYHSKRNHLSRFSAAGEWKFTEMNAQNLTRVAEFNERWFASRENPDEGLVNEHLAASSAIKNFCELGFSGGFLEVEGVGIVAYAIGEPINARTFCVHIEKATGEIEGAYTAINREFAAHFCADYEYINREDDAGMEGLRKAKLSYYPAMITEKFVITRGDNPW